MKYYAHDVAAVGFFVVTSPLWAPLWLIGRAALLVRDLWRTLLRWEVGK